MNKIHPWSSLNYGLTASEVITHLYCHTIPVKLGKDLEVQVLSPMRVGSIGSKNLNTLIQKSFNPHDELKPYLQIGDRLFRIGDRVIQKRNNYDLEVFNGDIGKICMIDNQEMTIEVIYEFGEEKRTIMYKKQDIVDLDLAYSITIHKSQGSEFDVVIIPLVMQHFTMLYRNLIYTAITRAKHMAILVGSRKSLSIAIRNIDNKKRNTMLKNLLNI